MSNALASNETVEDILVDEALINNEISANEDNVGIEVNSNFNSSSINSFASTSVYSAVTVTTSQLENLYENGPLDILPAPGEGLIYSVHACAFSLDEGGTVFNEDFQYQLMSLIYNSTTKPSVAYALGSLFLDDFENRYTYVNGSILNYDHSYVYYSECVNKPISLYPSGEFTATGGTTRLRVHVWYTIIEAGF